MPWAKFDDGAAFHPKILDAGNEAVGAWWRMIVYSAGALTDGKISRGQALAIALNPAVIERLLAVRLLDLDGDGYQIHDFGDYNPTGTIAQQARERRKQAAVKAARVRWGCAADAPTHAPTHADRMRGTCPDPDPDPVPTPNSDPPDQKLPRARTKPATPASPGDGQPLPTSASSDAGPKRKRKIPDTPHARILEVYSRAVEETYGERPLITPRAAAAVKALLAGRPEDRPPDIWPSQLIYAVQSYLADHDPWLGRAKHALYLLPDRVATYLPPANWRPEPPRQRTPAPIPIPLAGTAP